MEIEHGNVKVAPLPCSCCSIAHPYHAHRWWKVSKAEFPPEVLTHSQHREARITPGCPCPSPTVMPPWMHTERSGLWAAAHAFSIYHTAILCAQLEKYFHAHEHAWMEAAAAQLLIYHVFSFSDTGLAVIVRSGKTGWEEEMAGGWQLFQAVYFNWLWIYLNNLNLADAYCSSEEDIEPWWEERLSQVENLREKI